MTVLSVATHIWFDTQALAAAELYTSLLPDSRIGRVSVAGEGVPDVTPGEPFIVELSLMGAPFIFLNGGPSFPLNPQVSIYLRCEDQTDVDHYWDALLAGGGSPQQCGWLTDRFGPSWQVIPRQLEDLLLDEDRELVSRVTQAMLQMIKIDVAGLEAAAEA